MATVVSRNLDHETKPSQSRRTRGTEFVRRFAGVAMNPSITRNGGVKAAKGNHPQTPWFPDLGKRRAITSARQAHRREKK